MFPFQIHIIGQGKLGRSISHILKKKSIIHQFHGREFKDIRDGLIYLCLPEDIIPVVAQEIQPSPKVILFHPSGSLDIDSLHPHDNIGCLHPIQSFAGPEINIPHPIPATFQCLPSRKDVLLPLANQFAELLGFTLFPFSGSRLSYHTAAVISGNFATIIFHQAVQILVNQGVPQQAAIELLHPLAVQSIQNASKGTLQQTLTGPVIRNQLDLLHRQKENLEQDPLLQTLYEIVVKLAQRDLI